MLIVRFKVWSQEDAESWNVASVNRYGWSAFWDGAISFVYYSLSDETRSSRVAGWSYTRLSVRYDVLIDGVCSTAGGIGCFELCEQHISCC